MSNFLENSPHTLWNFSTLPDLDGALCDLRNGSDPEMWFLDDAVIQKVARTLCYSCPVMDECLRSAYEEESQTGYFAHGIRGGKLARCRQLVLNRMKQTDNE